MLPLNFSIHSFLMFALSSASTNLKHLRYLLLTVITLLIFEILNCFVNFSKPNILENFYQGLNLVFDFINKNLPLSTKLQILLYSSTFSSQEFFIGPVWDVRGLMHRSFIINNALEVECPFILFLFSFCLYVFLVLYGGGGVCEPPNVQKSQPYRDSDHNTSFHFYPQRRSTSLFVVDHNSYQRFSQDRYLRILCGRGKGFEFFRILPFLFCKHGRLGLA